MAACATADEAIPKQGSADDEIHDGRLVDEADRPLARRQSSGLRRPIHGTVDDPAQRSQLGRLLPSDLNANPASTPATNPPMWAMYATPPVCSVTAI